MDVRDYLEHLKGKPEPVRRQIALGAAASLTFLVALAWGTTLVASGTLALDESPESPDFSMAAGSMDDNLSGLAGAAAALEFDSMGEGQVTVVETKASTTLDREDEGDATVIPF